MSAQDELRKITLLKPAHASLLAGDAVEIWNPGARRFRLRKLYCRASAAGEYELNDSGLGPIGYLWLPANEWLLALDLAGERYGYLGAAAGSRLKLFNTTGGAASVNCLAVGSEE